MGIMEKVVSVLGFVDREEEEVEETVEEKPVQKVAPVALRQESKPAVRPNNVVAFHGGKETANHQDNTTRALALS